MRSVAVWTIQPQQSCVYSEKLKQNLALFALVQVGSFIFYAIDLSLDLGSKTETIPANLIEVVTLNKI